MNEADPERESYSHLIYALVSVLCPFVGFALMSVFQAYSYDWYWEIGNKPKPLDDADINAGAMMGVVIIVQIVLSVGLGSLIGLVFAALSLKRRTRMISFGTAALLLNLIPIAFVVWIYIRGL